MKKIFITNGLPRSGKDTFASLLSYYANVTKVSSIDKVKELASVCGWDGKKTEKDRKFLSDLKALTTEYSDMSFKYISEKVEQFNNVAANDNAILLIDIREPDEIERAKKAFNAETIMIENKNVPIISSNDSDLNVFQYEYDYIVKNNGTLEEFNEEVNKFANMIWR